MATDTVKAKAITNADAVPLVPNNPYLANGPAKVSVGTAEATAGAAVGSTYRLARVKSGDRVDRIEILCDALGTSCAANVGLYDTAANGGAVVDADVFGSAVSLASAITAPTDVTTEALDIAKIEKRVWEVLGLTADPFKEYDVVVTLTAATVSAGTISMRVTTVD